MTDLSESGGPSHTPLPGRVPTDGGPVAVVMDLGGNWIRVALATQNGDILWSVREPTHAQDEGQEIVARADHLLDQAISQATDRGVAGMGMALASPVDPETGIMYSPPNIPGLDGVSFKALWENRVQWPVLVGNDATLAALGEYRYGAGVGARTLVYITISTGIGGGIVIDGSPLMGANGMAGELGHMSINLEAPDCKCGHAGCLEEFASGTAIANAARQRAEERGSTVLSNMVSGDLGRISAETVFAAAARGDSVAVEVLSEAARALGAGLVNILHIFNPDVIAIGGGVSRNWDYLRPEVDSYIKAHAMSHVRNLGFKLVVSPLGDDIGLLGAAALVWQRVRQ